MLVIIRLTRHRGIPGHTGQRGFSRQPVLLGILCEIWVSVFSWVVSYGLKESRGVY